MLCHIPLNVSGDTLVEVKTGLRLPAADENNTATFLPTHRIWNTVRNSLWQLTQWWREEGKQISSLSLPRHKSLPKAFADIIRRVPQHLGPLQWTSKNQKNLTLIWNNSAWAFSQQLVCSLFWPAPCWVSDCCLSRARTPEENHAVRPGDPYLASMRKVGMNSGWYFHLKV